MGTQFGFTVSELIKSNRVTKESVSVIKTWQNEKYDETLPDDQIALFLIACKGDQELAKRAIETHISVKSVTPELFTGWNVNNENIKKILSVINLAVIPKQYLNSVIVIASFKDTDYLNFDFCSFCQLCLMTAEAILIDNPPEDIIIILDPRGVTFGHLMAIEMKVLKAFLEYAQDGIPLRIKAIHVLNSNYLVYAGYKMFQLFVNADEPVVINFHQEGESMEAFHELHVPKEYLPSDYDGDLDSSQEYHEQNVERLSLMQFHLSAIQKQFSCRHTNTNGEGYCDVD
ncbi:hypothetical protein RI129_007611 [Pyrocoelia pectoralis]|uniref:CRAL-TRIO domain-containing protein n=1 Tax=Pyrocoelia pectoralis TaxID=417401 RepID=A0AAN7VDX2_9COLE